MQRFGNLAADARARRFFVLSSVVLSLALLGAQAALFRDFSVDDTYISFRFVRQWTHGNGLVFNPGEYVEGYSNFLWLVLLAAADLPGFDLLAASRALGLACALLSLAFTWKFSARLLSGSYLVALPPLLLVAALPFGAWTMAGLEAPLFALLLLLAVYRFTQEMEDGGAWPISAALLALLGMTRPEGAVIFVVAAAYRAWGLYRSRRRPARRDLVWAAIFAAVYGGYFAWRVSYYHALLPNTVYAKSLGLHPRAFMEGLYYVGDFFLQHLGWGLAVLLIPLALLDRRHAVRFPAAVLAVHLAFLVYAGGDILQRHRFFAHVYPLLTLVVSCGLKELSTALAARSDLAPRAGAGLLTALAGALLLGEIFLTVKVGYLERPPEAQTGSDLVGYMEARLKPGDAIAVVDAGLLPYRMPLDVRVLDMVGLTDAHIARLPVRLPGGLLARWNGFGKWDVDYVLRAEPKFVQVHLLSSPGATPLETDWIGSTELINDPRFHESYSYLQLPGVNGIFERSR